MSRDLFQIDENFINEATKKSKLEIKIKILHKIKLKKQQQIIITKKNTKRCSILKSIEY